jgi:thiamine biosynthesis protein ThiS
MKVLFNGHEEHVPDNITLSELVAMLREGDPHLIVEHNGRFVYPHQFVSTVVVQGDRLEFINPAFGG